jgi:UDP-N-acetylglucosamine:LPS N-acetylglucosamine transferase
VVVPEDELDLSSQVLKLLDDPARLEEMGDAMRRLARPDAAEVIAEELIALARG